MSPDRDRAGRQLAEAIEHWIGLLEAYGLARRDRDPLRYARAVIAELDSDDPRIAAEAALSVAEWEPWVDHSVTDVAPSWWASDLGGLVLSAQTSGEMSVPEAMAALGLSRARVYQFLEDGRLRRGPSGGITRRSVARLLDQRSE